MNNTMNNQQMRYYSVKALGGHMGCGKTKDITFYFIASNAYEAMKKAQRMGGVKHTKFPQVVEISKEEYEEGRKVSAYKTEKTYTKKSTNGRDW